MKAAVQEEPGAETNKAYAVGLARAFGGAVIFAFPLMMTLEMWSLGVSMGRARLLLFIAVNFAILVGLSYFAGFEKTFSWKEDLMDALAAFGVGVLASAIMLTVFAVVSLDMTWSEIVGKIALQSVPASIGAMLGRKQLGGDQDTAAEEERKREAGYGGELFLMLGGALFLAFNVAPTEEMILIAYRMTPWHGLALGLISIALLHVFVYSIGFSGQESRPEGGSFLSTFLHFTPAASVLTGRYPRWNGSRLGSVFC
jgi:putative integral membrane protein (TIGR02587 family)